MRSLVTVALALCVAPVSASAQYTTQPGISVTGSAELTKSPELIRLYVKQYARGNDDDAAKSALVVAEKKLLTKLGESGVEVVFSSPTATQASPTLQNRYQNWINMGMNRRGALGGVPNNQTDKAIFLERFVCVDVRPKNKQQDSYALTNDLQERLRKGYQELTGLSAVYPKEDGNEQQAAWEQQMMRNEAHYLQQDLRLVLAARILREDRLKLYGIAVKKARGIAEDLAGAAGVGLGDLQYISSSFATSSRYGNAVVSGSVPYDLPGLPFFKDDAACEAVVIRQLNASYGQGYQAQAEQLNYQISLNVTYRIQPKE